jgi:hypothetical protein
VLNLLVRSALLLPALSVMADQVPVRHFEGRLHGFLVLRDLEDKVLASGSLIQNATGTGSPANSTSVSKMGRSIRRRLSFHSAARSSF